eukprot:1548448-Rhodomonas_salina.2
MRHGTATRQYHTQRAHPHSLRHARLQRRRMPASGASVCLRARYALSSTDLAYGFSFRMSDTDLADVMPGIWLRALYKSSDTDLASGATRRPKSG